jgi:hypothetical protein
MSLPVVNLGLQTVASRIKELVGSYIGNSQPFEVSGITVSFDPTQSKQLWTPFQLFGSRKHPFLKRNITPVLRFGLPTIFRSSPSLKQPSRVELTPIKGSGLVI